MKWGVPPAPGLGGGARRASGGASGGTSGGLWAAGSGAGRRVPAVAEACSWLVPGLWWVVA
ncbi:hypothetical protein ADK92_36330, partial [Streptomyces sp. XY533]